MYCVRPLIAASHSYSGKSDNGTALYISFESLHVILGQNMIFCLSNKYCPTFTSETASILPFFLALINMTSRKRIH